MACGRQHSLALARPRGNGKAAEDGNGGGGAAAATAAASASEAPSPQGTAGNPNLLYSWGRASFGRLGRRPPPPSSSTASLSSSLLFPPPPSLPRRTSASLSAPASSAVGLVGDGSKGGGSGGGGGCVNSGSPGEALGEPGGRRNEGQSSLERQREDVSSRFSGPPPPLSAPEGFSMPAVITADWKYRVNDHRRQGAPLVAVFAPASTAAAASATGAADADRVMYPFGSGDENDGGGAASDATGKTAPACRGCDGDGGGSSGGGSSGGGGRGPVAITAGWRHSAVVTEEGAVFTWGCGAGGKLGLGSHADVDTPRQVTLFQLRAICVENSLFG